MKFQVERGPLADAVAWTARALPARLTAPVLGGMRLDAGSSLTLSTYDYDVSAEATIPVTADEPGTVLVSGKLLAEIVRSLPSRPVDFTVDEARATVKCGSAIFNLIRMPAEEYPTLPSMPDVTGTVGADTFASAIHQVAIAAGRDDTLPALTGIRVEISGDTLTMIATDRYRLAIRKLEWNPAAGGLDTAVLIPARVLGDTARAMTGGAEVSIALAADDNGTGDGIIGFEGGGRRSTTRLLSGEYPRIQQLLPTEYSAAAELSAAPFAEAVKRVALVAERNTPVRLSFTSGEVLLEAGTGDEAHASEAIEASYNGGDLRTAFNPQFLIDAVSSTGTDKVRISFTSPTRPAVITAADVEGPDYRHVLMPIRAAG